MCIHGVKHGNNAKVKEHLKGKGFGMITIELNEQQERALVELINANPSHELSSIVESIRKEREWEWNNRFCNTDCLRFRAGNCPFKQSEHHKCVYYANDVKD